ncbi:MAG TPA: potassium-transporting ATPase subunit KdpC [Terracidiphilus sp.]|nr:potassium-transporting ATPase subunit KdpC [Terracidiphilus sp.]
MHSSSTLIAHEAAPAKTQDGKSQHPVWKTSILFTIVMTVVVGLGYPLVVTGIAELVFPKQANGSLILKNGQVIGSRLLAQSFTEDKYFHPRPSAGGYDATNSGGSTLAQTNAKLIARIQGDVDALQKQNPGKPVPIDLVTQSGSGLDPDITPDDANYQAPRVAKARGLTLDAVRQLIAQHTTGRELGFLGEPRVNVLELNLALDGISK